VAAYVGGEAILLRWVDQDVGLWARVSGVRSEDQDSQRQVMRWEVMQRWITRTLAAQEARRQRISISLREIEEALRGGSGLPATQRRVYEALRQHGATDDDLRVRVQLDLYLVKFRSRLQQEIAASVREEDAWGYYRSHPELFQHAEQVYVWVIAVREPELAREITRRARAGEDFRGLAERYSVHPTRTRGGEFGWLNRGGPAFEPLFALEPGAISDPIPYDGTWLVVKVAARRPPGLWPFREVREEAVRGLVQERLLQRQQELDRLLRAATRIEIRIPPAPRSPSP
jgi:hypothetical protein